MNDIRFKVLFLASWYPSKLHPVSGIFIKKHAETVSRFCDVAVLYVISDPKLNDKVYDVEYVEENGILTVRVYYKKVNLNIPLISKSIKFIRYIKGAYFGLKIIKEKFGRPNIVHVNVVMPAGLIAIFLKYLRKIPYVITEHCDVYIRDIKGFEKISIFSKLLMKLVVSKAECLTVDSHAMKDAMLALGFKSRFHVIPNVVDAPHMNINTENVFRDKKKIIHISLLSDKQKNVSGLIKAISNIYNNIGRKDFELHIIGDGPERSNHENLAKELGLLNECIVFHGYVSEDEKKELIANSDFHVLNSNFEGFSVVTAEAIAHGLPVIATKCGGPEDFVTSDVGILIEHGNQKQLKDAILYMLDNCNKYSKKKLHEYAKSRFSYEVVGRQIYEIYKFVLTEWEAGYCGEKIKILSEWQVLDVGSGNHPNKRSNVLLEKELNESIHRSGEKAEIPKDKILVLGDATSMPFKYKEFDYAIASHIAEHIEDIDKFISELTRVGKRGYIEMPGPVSEFFLNESCHVWIVHKKGDTLFFKRKKNFKSVFNIFYAIFYLNDNRYGHKTFKTNNLFIKLIKLTLTRLWKYIPFTYTKYLWEEGIKYRILK